MTGSPDKSQPRILSYTIGPQDDGKPLRAFLEKQGYSHHLLVGLKKEGLAVNGTFHRLIDPVFSGDIIEIRCPAETASLLPNPALTVSIAYRDEDVVIFHKPAGMTIHPCAKTYHDSLGNYFAWRFPDKMFRPVGRLDRDTTGLCLVAMHRLAAAIADYDIAKTYFAVLEGYLPQDQGTIDAPLLRVGGEKIKRMVNPAGQRAITHYRVLQKNHGYTLVSVTLETGRTHQIRAHMAWLGYPLAGDNLYGGSQKEIVRQALHCGEIRFRHPVTGEWHTVTSPLPEDMAKLLR